MFFDGERFAGQGGFFGLQLGRLDDAHIGGDDFSGFEQDDIAGDQFGTGDRRRLPFSHHNCRCSGHFLERCHGLFGAVFLAEPEDSVQEHDHGNGDRICRLSQCPGDDGSGQQDDDHEILELVRGTS